VGVLALWDDVCNGIASLAVSVYLRRGSSYSRRPRREDPIIDDGPDRWHLGEDVCPCRQ